MRFYLLILFALMSTLSSDEPRRRISVNNRVLAQVNGNAISVIDVKKKMDMIIFQNYPQYLDMPEARFEFYSKHWKEVLNDLIDRELMIQDADEKGFPISSGDIREELEEIFGPEVMINLDNAGLTLDEAWKMVKADITIRRMLYYQVRMRIMAEVTPSEIRKAYDEVVKTIGSQKECVWRCATIKSTDTTRSSAYADKVLALLQNEQVSLDALQNELEKRSLVDPEVQLLISQTFCQKQSELAKGLQDLLLNMKEGSYSTPQLQTSRSDQNPVIRIYFVEKLSEEKVPSLQELEPRLRENIIQEMTAKKTALYFDNLRRHFHLSKDAMEKELPVNFQPFVLK